MFSLIVTLIAIALVVALALATLYFGGAALERGADTARATQVVNQSTQLMGALDLFQVDQGRWPNSLSELVPDYLVELPSRVTASSSGSGSSLSLAAADATDSGSSWTMLQPGVPLARLASTVPESLCKEVNRLSRGDNGILTQARPTFRVQCYGQDLSSLKVVVGRHPSSFSSALPPGELSSEPVPSSLSDTGWLAPPTAGGSSASSGGGGQDGAGSSQTAAEAACAAVSLPTGWANTTYECPIVVYRNQSGTVGFHNTASSGYPEGTPMPGDDAVTASIPGLSVTVNKGYGVYWGWWQGAITGGVSVTGGWSGLPEGARVLGTLTVRTPDGTFTYPVEFRNEDVAPPPKLPGGGLLS